MTEEKRTFDNGSIEGFVARDPEYNASGTALSFSIPIAGRWDREAQAREDATVWVRVVAFSGLAEAIADNIRKGDLVRVSGTFQAHSWTTRDGEERTDLEMVASSVCKKLLPAKKKPQRVKEQGSDLPF